MAWGIAAIWGGSSILMVGAGVGTGVVLNRFSEADPTLGQGVPYLTGALGMHSSGGGLYPLFWGLLVGHGTSANCPVANLYTITSIDVAVDLVTGVWVEVVATVRVGAAECTGAVGVIVVGTGWARTLTSFGVHSPLPFVICLWSWGLPNHGIGAWLGWLWMGLLWLGLGLRPGFWTKLPF